MRGPPIASVSMARSAARRRVMVAPSTKITPVACLASSDASVTASTGGVSTTTQSNGPSRSCRASPFIAADDSSSEGFGGGVPAGRIHRLGDWMRVTAVAQRRPFGQHV